MRKNVSKVLLSVFTIMIMLSIIGSINAVAVEGPDQTIDVQGDAIQIQLEKNIRTMFRFHETTQLTICANNGLDLDINCDALRIGDKDVIIEVEADDDCAMTMTCTREEAQLGLMKGSLHRVRNRNTYQYLEGFCISVKCTSNCNCECKCNPECTCVCDCQCKCDPVCTCSCDCECNCKSDCTCVCDCQCKCDPVCTCECNCQCKCDPQCVCDCDCPYNGSFLKARLGIRATNQNRLGEWAYYDDETEEWVTVPTTNEVGYLFAEMSTLSAWTLLVPETTEASTIGITIGIVSVSIIGILTISGFYLKKRH